MRSVEAGEMVKLGMIESTDAPSFSYLPTPYLSIFLVPFQILSHFKIGTSLVIWLIINGLLLAGYLIFFSRIDTWLWAK